MHFKKSAFPSLTSITATFQRPKTDFLPSPIMKKHIDEKIGVGEFAYQLRGYASQAGTKMTISIVNPVEI